MTCARRRWSGAALFWGCVLLLLMACNGPSEDQANSQSDAVAERPAEAVDLEGQAVIYLIGPLSGVHAEKGQAQLAGARLAAHELNQQGGLLGREVIIRSVNDQGSVEGAQAAAREVQGAVEAGDTLVGVVVFEGSDPQLTAVQEHYLTDALGASVLVVSPVSTEPDVQALELTRFFRLSAPHLEQASEIAAMVLEAGLEDAAVVHSADAYGEALRRGFEEAAQGFGLEAIVSFAIDPEASSHAEVVQQIQELNPSALMYAGGELEAAVFFGELFGFEFQGSVYGTERAQSYAVVDELGCQAEGMNFASPLPDPSAVFESHQLSGFAELTGRNAEPYAVAGHAAVELIATAYDRAGTLDGEAAAGTVRGAQVSTVMGELDFDDAGNVRNPTMHLFQVEGRAFTHRRSRPVGDELQQQSNGQGESGPLLARDFAADAPMLVFAGLDWDSATFSNTVARFIVESAFDIPTRSELGSSVPLFQSLRRGDLDIYMETWLPNSQELFESALAAGQIVDLGLNYGDVAQGWYVPRYLLEGSGAAAPDLRSVEDLPRYAELFRPEGANVAQLLDGSPGWFSYKINCMKLRAYRLDGRFAQRTTGSETALFARLSAAYEAQEPVLAYLFEPTWPIAGLDLVRLEEPEFSETCWQRDKRCAFPPSQVHIAVAADLPERAPEVSAFLQAFSLQADDISESLLLSKEQGIPIEEAALRWLEDHQAIWSEWLPAGAAARVQQALAEQ